MRAPHLPAGLLLLAVLGGAETASAQAAQTEVGVEAHGIWKRVANGQNVTGGFGPEIRASVALALSDDARVAFGANFLALGFEGGSRTLWTLGGPTIQITGHPWQAPVWLTSTLALEVGRVQLCNRWPTPLCPRFVGIFPELDVGAMWEPGKGVKLGPSVGVQYFSAQVGTLVGVTVAVSGVVSFGVGGR